MSAPILLPSGDIVTQPGYNPDTGLILNINGDWPALMDNATAIEKLEYTVCDFPFTAPSHKSAMFAALLTLVCRNLIPGNTPFFPFDGNRPGCGKGLATDVITMIAEGRRASRYNYNGNKEELRKMLTAVAIEGLSYVLFDNIQGKFGDSVLEAAMTTGRIADRLLSFNKNVDLPLTVCWFGTVNGMIYERDMLRRSVPIKFDTLDENPQLREGFKEPSLLRYVSEKRRELLIAALSIVANFIRDGKPILVKPFGSFSEWSDLIRGALIYAHQSDPCEHCSELYAELSDSVASIADELLAAWKFEEQITVAKALTRAKLDRSRHSALLEIAKRSGDESAESNYLGNLLRSIRGQVRNGRCFDRTEHDRPKWFIVSN